MNKLIRLITIAFLVGAAAGACGQKGPLYLPGDPSQIRSEVPQQESNDEDEDEESANDDPR